MRIIIGKFVLVTSAACLVCLGLHCADAKAEGSKTLSGQEKQFLVAGCQCRYRSGSGKTLLIFQLGSNASSLWEMRGSSPELLADVKFDKGSFTFETNGGVWSYARVEALISELLSFPFMYDRTNELNELISNASVNRVCTSCERFMRD